MVNIFIFLIRFAIFFSSLSVLFLSPFHFFFFFFFFCKTEIFMLFIEIVCRSYHVLDLQCLIDARRCNRNGSPRQ